MLHQLKVGYNLEFCLKAMNVDENVLTFTSKDDDVIGYSHYLDLAGYFSEVDEVIRVESVN